jgi:hypothetical protein
MINILNLTNQVTKDLNLVKTDINPYASLPDRGKVLYRVAKTKDETTNYVVMGDEDGPPNGPCVMFSLEALIGVNPNLNLVRLL